MGDCQLLKADCQLLKTDAFQTLFLINKRLFYLALKPIKKVLNKIHIWITILLLLVLVPVVT